MFTNGLTRCKKELAPRSASSTPRRRLRPTALTDEQVHVTLAIATGDPRGAAVGVVVVGAAAEPAPARPGRSAAGGAGERSSGDEPEVVRSVSGHQVGRPVLGA